MKDYYKILGVEEEASEEEIQARWIELTKRYDPELSKGSDAGEYFKEVNEAYEVLKNKSTRVEYDVKRTLRRVIAKKTQEREGNTFLKKKIILPSGILVLFLIVGLLILRWFYVPPPPESETYNDIGKILEEKTASQIPPEKTKSKVQVDKDAQKEITQPFQRSPSVMEWESERKEEFPQKILPDSKAPVKVEKEVLAKEKSKPVIELAPKVAMKSETPVKVGREVPKEVPKEALKEAPREAPKEAPREVVPKEFSKEVRKEVPKEVPKEVKKEALKEVPKEVTGAILRPGEKLPIKTKEEKEVAKEMSEVVPRESAQINKPKSSVIEPQPVQKPETSVKAEKVASVPPPSFAKEEEVKRFFSNYIDRYNRKDIDGFLSFFSSKAVQNQKDGLEGIKSIYAKFFNQSQELRYHVEGMKIELYQNSVEVKARFRVDQKLRKSGEEKIWRGNIRWVLVKEDGNLKINSLDYQNEKSP